jgi:hypothetical protein
LGDRLVLQVPSKLIAVDPVSAAPTGWVAYLIGGTMLDSFVDASHFIVAGNFRGAGGVPRAGLAAVSWPDGAPTTWAPDPPIPMSRAVFGPLALVGPRLFVYDSTWLRELDPISGNTISVTSLAGVIAISGVGTRLYVAGAFNAINGLTRRGIASFDISGPVPVLESWAPVLTFPPVSNPAGVTNILATDRVVLVSGGFTDVNGVPRNGLAAIDAVTAAVLPWAPPFRDVGFDLSADRLWISGFEPSSTATGGQAAFNFSGEQLPWQAAPSPLPLQLGEARTQQHAVVFGNRLYVGRGYAIEQSTGAVVNWTPSFEGQPTFSVFSSRWSAAPGRGVVLHRHAGGFDLFPRVDLPARPIDVTASATAGSAALAWGPVVGAVSYVIEVGTSAGASNLGTIETTGPVTSFATAAPTGTYFVRLRARTTSGLSGASAEQRIVIGANACGAAPNPPHSMTAEIASARATLRWFAPVGGPVPTRYIVEVRDGLGANLITSIDAGPNLSLTGPVSTGSYYWVRVRAASACGLSDPTDDVLIAS